MTTQMLLLLPLLAGSGALLGAALPQRVSRSSAKWDYLGITGLVLASVVAAFWLLPRMSDSAIAQPAVDVARYFTVPLLIGLPLAVSWPRAGFIVRGVFLLEFIATLFRMGWLYLVWPDRLCNYYLLGDQQRLGQYLVLIGVTCCLAVGTTLLWGNFESHAQAPRAAARR
ncbi:MAG: hypothetical protein JSR67_11945 [Proteobacteria bacterium]|nr:hypothetical protein [Pseudomonadota bacterium]